MTFTELITKNSFLIGILIIVLCACKETEMIEPIAQARPNILFIMSDDHTSQAWGVYGGVLEKHAYNKNIKRLTEEGALLKNAFCTNSICVPSRGAILTGQYSHQNDIFTLSDHLSPESNNIAKVLQHSGYETAIIGKWHLKKEPAGFDHYSVLPGQGVYNNPKLKTKGIDIWQDHNKGGTNYEGFSADVIGDHSIEWLKNRNSKKPFFLMTHFKATHEPFDYPERHTHLYDDIDIPEPESLYDFGPKTTGRSFIGQKLEIAYQRYLDDEKRAPEDRQYPGHAVHGEGLDSIQIRKLTYQKFVKDFLKSGAAIDDNIGNLLDYLEDSKMADNTIVIYTADQGYFLGEHGFFDKRMIYEEALRMPFVIRYPKEIKGGSKIDDIILNIDFPALFADYAGIKKPDFIQGSSFRNILNGHPVEDWRDEIYYRYWQHIPVRPAHFGIRDERYKLALFYGQPLDMNGAQKETTEPAWEFYDLQEDPNEVNNAYNDPSYKAKITEMKKRLSKLRQEIGDTDEHYPIMQDIFKDYWK
ncbi:MAG: arylsulfatase A-like enzyme [Saprospiraceae bacterium]|jgi:arylsulfatase A-like enzyme